MTRGQRRRCRCPPYALTTDIRLPDLMDPLHILLLVVAGIVGGIISSIAGGAALFIFPALLATGLSPVVATAVSTTALTPSLFLAALYDRALLPLLLGFATVLFAFAGRISAWLTARAAPDGEGRAPHSLAALLPVCVYGGYFGAGVGVLMLGVLSVGTGGDYRSANVTKNLVSSLNSLTAAVIFAVQGVVAWPATLVMIAGTLIGALVGARLAQVMPNQTARGLVVIVGALLTAVFAWRYWF